jgi:hypothetical protein
METLPNEILFEILSYLDLDQRKDKRIVCRLWNQIILCLPISLSEFQKEMVSTNMLNISIQIHFASDIIEYAYESEKLRTYSFLDNNHNILFDLSMDPSWETFGNYFTNVYIDNCRWNKIRIELEQIFDSDFGMIETYVFYFKYLLKAVPEIKFINDTDIDVMKHTQVKDVMAVIKNDKKYLMDKYENFRDIFVFELLKSYRDTLFQWSKNITQVFPNYIIHQRDRFEKYLSQL